MTENHRKKNSSRQDRCDTLGGLRKKIILQAVFSVVTLLLTAVLLFSLTAAWYTNVADTGGLTFDVKKWDFKGQITVGSTPITMAPGDSGIIPMTVSNNGQEVAVAGVTVNKSALDDEMQQRLYFYVDTPFYRSGERMERVYVNSVGGYTYTVFPGGSISIDESVQNAPALRWEWVYDVLGYYVRGSVTENADPVIEEYIRPIEYDYDPVLTQFDESGKLTYIDGSTSVEEFLSELSETDGYSGEIDADGAIGSYYPVSVNESGYGVWVYLCTKTEIEKNMKYDAEVGSGDRTSYSVSINVTGSNSRETALEVGSAEMLATVLASTSYPSIKLTDDIALSDTLTLESGKRVDIDLNGKTLSSSAGTVIKASEGSSLTLTNGDLVGCEKVKEGYTYGVLSEGGEVTLYNVNVGNVEEGVCLRDLGGSSNVRIIKSTITASEEGVWFRGVPSEKKSSTLIIENSKITGMGNVGVLGNGNYSGTNIQITGSTIRGMYAAIYHPQADSTLRITNCELEGYTGLAVKGGTVYVEDCKITGNLDKESGTITVDGSGFFDSGDGIYLEANYTDRTARIIVTGDKTVVTSKKNQAIRMYPNDESVTNKSITVSGGKYNTSVANYLAEGVAETENAAETETGKTYTVMKKSEEQ